MTSLSENRTTDSESIFKEIQTEHMIYQINSSADAKKNADKIKKNVDEITKVMENARSVAYEKKIATDELKIELSEKKDKMKMLRQEYERAKKHTELISKKTSDLIAETNKIVNTIERIKEAAQGLDTKYLEQSQKDLADSLVKITLETEKSQSDLNAARKMEEITSKKVRDIEMDFNKLESHTIDKINETERTIANVSITIEHIIKSYDEMAMVSKELLKSAISTPAKIELEEKGINEVEQNQSYQEIRDIKVAI
ncbi:MAG: hypothetical protein OER82_04500 [Nitrosopumilus sp.]|nr:hypothetical protein [Nitrosopumilus sp.]